MPRKPDDRQPALALVPGRPAAPATDSARAAAARKVSIGPQDERLWLEWRAERQQYRVAWYDRASRTVRRESTGIGPGPGVDPPREAHEALAAAWAARVRPQAPQIPAEVGLSTVLTRYLAEHCTPDERGRCGVHDPSRQAYAVLAIEKTIGALTPAEKAQLGVQGLITLDHLGRAFVAIYARKRRADGVADSTIKRELNVLRAAVNWAAEAELIKTKPYIPKLIGVDELKTRPRKLAYSLPQIAAILEAAWSIEDRQHVHLFIITMLASHARTEAILECNLDSQLYDGVIDWLGPVREQTKKRRSMTPVGPTLAAWLEGRSGKLIVSRQRLKPLDEDDEDEPPRYRVRPTLEIDTAFANTLLAAGEAHPSLALRRPLLGPDGEQLTRIKRVRQGGRFVDTEVPRWAPIGSPNTFRHTVHTQLRRVGVPRGQIDAASGHMEPGTGRHYDHLDAKHDLKDFVAGVEQIFEELGQHTKVHLRTHCGPKVIDLAARRAGNAA